MESPKRAKPFRLATGGVVTAWLRGLLSLSEDPEVFVLDDEGKLIIA